MSKIITIVFLLITAGFLSCEINNHKNLTMLKVTELGSSRLSDSAIVNVLHREANLSIEIKYDLSEDTALIHLEDKTIDLAILPNNTAVNTNIKVRTVIPLLPRVLMILAHNIPDLDNVKIKNLFENYTLVYEDMSRMDSLFFRQFLLSFNIDQSKIYGLHVNQIDLNSWGDSSFVFVGLTHLQNPLLKKLVDMNSKMVSLDDVNELGKGSTVEGFLLSFPSIYPFILPKNIYKGEPKNPVLTIAIRDILVARADLSDEIVYSITKTLIENKPQLIQEDRIYNMLETDFSNMNSSFPLHNGTKQYIERNKPSVWSRYASIIWPFVSMLAILIGALVSFSNRMKHRQKLRIEVFYQKLLKLRKKAFNEQDNTDIDEILKEMRKIRMKAFEALSSNKLEGNESFNIFLSLYSEIQDEVNVMYSKSNN